MFDDKTHFVGVLPPKEIDEIVQRDRLWVRERYGCRSGHSTVPHITLVPPFSTSLPTDRVRDILMGILPLLHPFICEIDGYGSFGDRTVFLRVIPSKEWDDLAKTLSKGMRAMGLGVREEKKPLSPHLTIANRDIPPNALKSILSGLYHNSVKGTFPVESVALFHREGRVWRVDEKDNIRIG